MKRFLVTTVLIAAILGVMLYFAPKPMQSDVYSYVQYNPTINVYCRDTTCDASDMGLGYQVTCTAADFNKTLASCRNVDGVSVSFAGAAYDVNEIVSRLQATEVSRQQIDDIFVSCYYSPLIREYVTIDGNRVNVQIAYRGGTVTVGYPLILGSY